MRVPDAVVAKARAEGAGEWLASLPALVGALGAEWGFEAGPAYEGGTEAYVAPVTLAGGVPAVLKLLPSGSGEMTVLRLAGGDGCVALLRSDEPRGAMLLERLGPPLAESGLPDERRAEILAGLARRLWRPAPDAGLPTGAAKGRWLIGFIERLWDELDRPCSERAVDHAIACARRRIEAHDDERAVLVHGDLHDGNALRAGDGWKLIDPDGLLAEAEYDLGVLLREVADPGGRARVLAARTGLDARAIGEWAAVERLSTGLLAASIGWQPVAARMLAAAEAVSVLSE